MSTNPTHQPHRSALAVRRIGLAILAIAVAHGLTAQPLRGQEEGGLLDAFRVLLDQRAAREIGAQNRRGPVEIEAKVAHVDADFVNMFTPSLSKVLTAELHFVKKVCDPSPEQFDEIHRVGLLAVARLSKRYEELQRIRQDASEWPRPDQEIAAALNERVRQTMPADVAERYHQEITDRAELHHSASVGMIVSQIDTQLLLSPDQYRTIRETVDSKWSNQWSDGERLLMYPQYSTLPNVNVLGPHLTPRQRQVWTNRQNRGTVNFGWQMELGLQDWFAGGIELPAFDKPARKLPDPNAGARWQPPLGDQAAGSQQLSFDAARLARW